MTTRSSWSLLVPERLQVADLLGRLEGFEPPPLQTIKHLQDSPSLLCSRLKGVAEPVGLYMATPFSGIGVEKPISFCVRQTRAQSHEYLRPTVTFLPYRITPLQNLKFFGVEFLMQKGFSFFRAQSLARGESHETYRYLPPVGLPCSINKPGLDHAWADQADHAPANDAGAHHAVRSRRLGAGLARSLPALPVTVPGDPLRRVDA